MRNFLSFVGTLSLALMVSTAWAGEQGSEQGEEAKAELPPAVAKAVKDNRPNADIDKLTIEKKAGIALYDIEFKAGQGEIEVAEDGTVLDIATIVEMEDVPKAAAEAIQKAAAGAKITRLEKSEVRAEFKEQAGKGKIVKLGSPRYVFEAQLVKGNQEGEVVVAADGKVIEAVKWTGKGAK
jgi:uncharacterized membrane protein YkoI